MERLTQPKSVILHLLTDYCKYLYEEEKERTERIERKLNLFTVALGGGFIAVLMKAPSTDIWAAVNRTSMDTGIAAVILFAIALCLFCLSSLYTFLVYRVRVFERLCDPKEMARKAEYMDNESAFLSAVIADYTVATNRNHRINDIKARHLSYALLLLLVAMLFVVASVVLLGGRRGA